MMKVSYDITSFTACLLKYHLEPLDGQNSWLKAWNKLSWYVHLYRWVHTHFISDLQPLLLSAGDQVAAWKSYEKCPSALSSTGMYFALSTLGGFVLPAPLPTNHQILNLKDMEVIRSSEFQDATENAFSLITKILDEIPAVHESMISSTVRSGHISAMPDSTAFCAADFVPTLCLNMH